MNNSIQYDYLLKFLMIGNPGAGEKIFFLKKNCSKIKLIKGKSTMLNIYSDDLFEIPVTNIGVKNFLFYLFVCLIKKVNSFKIDFKIKTIELGKYTIKLQLWDTVNYLKRFFERFFSY